MAVWSFQLSDLAFNPVGEILNAQNRTVNFGLSRPGTASVTIRLDNPLIPFLDQGMGYIKAYRDSSLLFFGPIVGIQEAGQREDATLAVTASDASWILAHRLAGKTPAGIVIAAAKDRAQIVKDFIDAANAENETHIDTTGTIAAASASTYQANAYKPISECLADLAASLDGFDWLFLPRENFFGGVVSSSKIASFYAQPVIGTTKPEAIFEWGVGRRNVVSYNRAIARDTQANKVYHNVDSGADAAGYPTVSQLDSDSIARWGLMEDLAQADLLDNGLRQQLVNEHVRIRSQPRQVIEFQPHIDDGTGRVPNFGVDYGIGDMVRARIKYGSRLRVDSLVRVFAVSFALDTEGLETTTLTLSDDGT